MSHSGHSSSTSAGDRKSTRTPIVAATPAYWWYSSMRSWFMASRMLPTGRKPASRPVLYAFAIRDHEINPYLTTCATRHFMASIMVGYFNVDITTIGTGFNVK